MKKIVAFLLVAFAVFLPACSQSCERDFFAMDTYMHILVYGDEDAIDEAEQRIKALDLAFSVSNGNGELYTLNSVGELSLPSAELLEMLACAKILYERTGGAYDVTAYALTRLWEACEQEGRIPTEQEINAARLLVGMDRICFDESKVSLNGVDGIDLGSIAKGYAGREAAGPLAKKTDGGILTLGGNVVTYGKKPDGEPYRVGITDPNAPDNVCGYITVGAANVVTSGKYNRYFTVGGQKYHHILDARTGMPCENGVASVTVVCDDGMWADGLSTALFLLGEQGALDYYRTYGGFEAVIVMDDGRIVTTSDKIGFTRI